MVIPSNFAVNERKKTLKLTTDTLDCDKVLVVRKNGSVLNFVRTWISTGELLMKILEARQSKGLLGYANQSEKKFIDKETQLVCR